MACVQESSCVLLENVRSAHVGEVAAEQRVSSVDAQIMK